MNSYVSDTSFASYLEINIELTEEGLENMWEIVPIIFSYTKMLIKEGVEEWIYQETKELSEIGFKYEDKDEGTSVVTCTSSNLQNDYIPRELLLKSRYIYENFDKNTILSLLENYITPNCLRIFVLSQKYQDTAELSEEWYQTKYSIEDFSENFLKEISDPFNWNELNPPLHLPLPNIYIPKNFDLKPRDDSSLSCSLIRDDTHCKVWYKQDQNFKQPKGSFDIFFESPVAYSTPRDTVISLFFIFIFFLLICFLNN